MPHHISSSLPHLEDAFVFAKNNNYINMQSIALEGWRRGLDLTFYRDGKNKIKYSLSNGKSTHHFLSSKETNSNAIRNIEKTKQRFSKNNVPIPKGKFFKPGIGHEELISYAIEIEFPVVLKVVNSSHRPFLNIQNLKELKSILDKYKKRFASRKLLIEKFIEGDELNFFIIENKVISVAKKIPITVIGTGKDSIHKLINYLNTEREKYSYLNNKLIKVNKRLKNILSKKNYTINSIPKQNEQVDLQKISDLSNKGDSVNVTTQVTDDLKDIAIQAGNAVSSVPCYEVKMIANFQKNTETVLSVNTTPNIADHLLPTEGDPIDIPKKIIDYYFPGTKDFNRSYFYFNFEKINDLLNSHSATSINVTNCPKNKFFAKLYLVSGKVQKVSYRKWISKKAKRHNLYGYTRNLDNGDVEVLVAGEENTVNEFKQICLKGPKKARVENIKEFDWEKPVEIGFEIKPTKTI